MEKEFAPYKQALDLVLLGYTEYSELYKDDKEELFDMRTPNDAPCILWQQAFRWLYQKLDIEKGVMPLDTESQQLLLKELIDKVSSKHLLV